MKNRHPLLDLVQVAFIITDVHSTILYKNRFTERLFGYTGEELKGEKIRFLFLEEDLIYFLPNILFLTLYKDGFQGEALLKQKDGTKVFVHLSTAAFKEEGEMFLTFSFQEIHRLKEMERERLEVKHWASLGMMVEEIAHQVRNPIVSIGGYAQRILKSLPSSPKSKSYLNQILRETKRLETMVQRVEECVLIPKPFFRREKLQEMVEMALQTVSKGATERGVLLNLETGSLVGNGYLFIDKGLMIRVLSHILENSLEAIAHKPSWKKQATIRMVLFGDDKVVGISIIDQGEGIAKKNLRSIFEPFFSTRPDRVGLGLTFVKRAAEELGGSIQVESRLRKGTTVTLIFPKDRRRKVRQELLAP